MVELEQLVFLSESRSLTENHLVQDEKCRRFKKPGDLIVMFLEVNQAAGGF